MRSGVRSTPRHWAGLAVLSGGLALAGCGGAEEPAAPAVRPSVRVEATLLEARPVPRTVEAIGSVNAWVQVSPGTKIMGRVGAVAVRVGDSVRQGQVLATLEKQDLEAGAAQARATVAVAAADLENARAQFERMTQLHARNSVTEKSLEDATSTLRVAEARLAQAEAGLAAADVTLGYARIVSPISGRVTAKRVEAGDMASPGMALFTVEDTSKVKVVVQLAESDVVGLASGDPARVRVDVLEREWEATIGRVLPAGDPASRSFQIELELANADGQLKSGMFARAFLDRGTREALVVPRTAVVNRGPLEGVFTIDDRQVAHLRWVRLGPSHDDRVEVLSGLSGGERIVSAPPPGFVDGTPVETR